ncbi:MAG: hypothetical protein IPM60_15340 [Rhodospirillales bacterium]|nr:hypothetical protein [Rhodospirillales bacterium]
MMYSGSTVYFINKVKRHGTSQTCKTKIAFGPAGVAYRAGFYRWCGSVAGGGALLANRPVELVSDGEIVRGAVIRATHEMGGGAHSFLPKDGPQPNIEARQTFHDFAASARRMW